MNLCLRHHEHGWGRILRERNVNHVVKRLRDTPLLAVAYDTYDLGGPRVHAVGAGVLCLFEIELVPQRVLGRGQMPCQTFVDDHDRRGALRVAISERAAAYKFDSEGTKVFGSDNDGLRFHLLARVPSSWWPYAISHCSRTKR